MPKNKYGILNWRDAQPKKLEGCGMAWVGIEEM